MICQKSFKVDLGVFQGSFVFIFWCCMTLFATTRAEGGLVRFRKEVFLAVCPGKKRHKAILLPIAELCQD